MGKLAMNGGFCRNRYGELLARIIRVAAPQ